MEKRVHYFLSSWTKLLEAAQIRKHERILSIPVGENELPICPAHYHRSCRSAFTHKKELSKFSVADGDQSSEQTQSRKSKRDMQTRGSPVLPNHCIFCKKEKYKPKSSTREKTRSCMEFRADDRVRKSATLHVQMCTEMNDVAQEVLGLCLKDLISREAATGYKNFVRVIYQSK